MAGASNGFHTSLLLERLGTNSTEDAGGELGREREDTGSLAGSLGASWEGSACQGTRRRGATFRGTMPKAYKGFNLQSCLIRTQNPKQEQCNSSDTKYKSSDLKTNPASLPTHGVLAKLPFLPALLPSHLPWLPRLTRVFWSLQTWQQPGFPSPIATCTPSSSPVCVSAPGACPTPCCCSTCSAGQVLQPSREVSLAKPQLPNPSRPIKQSQHPECLSLENSEQRNKSIARAVKSQHSDKKPTGPLHFPRCQH